ncbi:ECF RNA polymerase sigma factor SigK [Arthrobacter castelli]|uniref:ECF RNA polymerase sigma factor SigK n=1 Tax=Arthrobacter castelli TaxID=271431 RepID=UPI00047C36EA|nr:ECF RNA polymerase sigma factor SigK [Arthrobacter castelli]
MDTPNARRPGRAGVPEWESGPSGPASGHGDLQRLLQEVGHGDRDAFVQLYHQTARRVFGMCKRILVDAQLSEDTAQEVYLQIWKTADRYSADGGSPLAWLLTIAHRRAVDKVRSEQRSADREAQYGATVQMVERDDVVDTVTEQGEAEAVVNCLKTLTGTQHESVELAYYGGLTYREVAERLGVAVPTIKSRIRDGLIRLKQCLGGELR